MALKIGAEDRKKVLIAGGLGLVVLVLLVKTLVSTFSGPSTPPPVAAPAPTITSAPAARSSRRTTLAPRNIPASAHEAVKVPGSLAALDPTLHPELMERAESLVYAGKGRNIFSMSAAPDQIEQLHASIRPHGQVGPVVPQGPPPPPPINLKFFGYVSQSGAKKAFLLQGDDVFIATAGDVVDHRYKVVRIDPTSIQVEDLPYNNTQTLPLIQN